MSSQIFSESRFWKHIGFILLAKITILCVLWYAFFGPDHRIKPDADAMQHHLTGSL